MQRRSTAILLIGVLTLVLGAATTYAAVRGPKRASAAPHAAAPAPPPPAGAPGGFAIPEGKRALAVALDPVAGTGGIAKVGDHVDVFAAVEKKESPDGANHARMVLQGVEVLRVTSGTPMPTPGDQDAAAVAPNGTTLFVLAVTPTQAEKVVFHASFSRLWFAVVPANGPKVPNTPGVSTGNQLQPEAV